MAKQGAARPPATPKPKPPTTTDYATGRHLSSRQTSNKKGK